MKTFSNLDKIKNLPIKELNYNKIREIDSDYTFIFVNPKYKRIPLQILESIGMEENYIERNNYHLVIDSRVKTWAYATTNFSQWKGFYFGLGDGESFKN